MSTTDELAAYYANLLILQYRSKARAYATVRETCRPVIMDQLPTAVQNAYGLDTAVGVQLDIVGKYAGVSRNGYDFSGPITLSDSDFRTMIKVAIAQNSAGSSLADIQNLLFTFFAGSILVFDFSNMQMGYFFSSAIGSKPLAELFVKQGLLPKPMGVQLATLIYAAVINLFFSFRTYDYPVTHGTPFNTYDSYNMNSPWLSYNNGISP